MLKSILLSALVPLLIVARVNSQQTSVPEDVPRGIVGGQDARIGDYPYQAALIVRHVHKCGASIISKKWLLTAAHCCVGQRASTVTVRVGSASHKEGGALHQIRRMVYHKNYNHTTDDNDICVMKTSTPLIYNGNVKAIPMAAAGTAYTSGMLAAISGFGRLVDSPEAPSSDVLQYVHVPVIDNERCRELYKPLQLDNGITERQLCAVHPDGGKDSCQGDSGGPMVINGSLAGIVSRGIGCGIPIYPGIYTNVAAYRPWIHAITGV